MLLVNLNDFSTCEIHWPAFTHVRDTRFHPSGRWLAASLAPLPKDRSQIEPPASSLPQPRIALVDALAGQVLETIHTPQAYQMSIAFSPDGNTLASGSEGCVLLWDMTIPPGELQTEPVVGQAVELSGTTVDGQQLDPVAYRGKMTLVTFWATWCQPCVAEMPELKGIYHDLHDRGFEVVGASLDEADTDLKSFVKNQDLPWANLHGTSPNRRGEPSAGPQARRHVRATIVPQLTAKDGSWRSICQCMS